MNAEITSRLCMPKRNSRGRCASFRCSDQTVVPSLFKYTRAIQTKLNEWMVSPSEDFVRMVSSELLGTKRFTPAVRDQFTLITRRAFEQLVGEKINERLKGAMAPESVTVQEAAEVLLSPKVTPEAAATPAEPQVVTSLEELEGFHIVRAIVRGLVSTKRIVMRDAQSYCAILLDDNNRKPICRLRFNNREKLRLGLFNEKKDEELVNIESPDDIYNYALQIQNALKSYLPQSEG